MAIRVHYPNTEEEFMALKSKVALVYTQEIVKSMNALKGASAEKSRLIKKVVQEAKTLKSS